MGYKTHTDLLSPSNCKTETSKHYRDYLPKLKSSKSDRRIISDADK